MKGINIMIWFSFIAVLIFFSTVLIYQTGDEYVLTPLDNISKQIAPDMGISEPMQTHIESLPDEYRDINVPYDLGFVLAFITVFTISISSAIKSRQQSWFEFFGTITIGFMILLFMTGFFITMKEWFVFNLIENFLQFDLGTTPIFYFYINNIGIINFIWMIGLVLLNKLDLTTIREDDQNNINIPGGNI